MTPYREFNRRALESLIRCGALDGLSANRRQMLEASAYILEQMEDVNRRNVSGQMGFFDDPEMAEIGEPKLPNVPEFPFSELLAMEKEVAGLYLTGNPMKPYEAVHRYVKAARIDRILDAFADEAESAYRDGQAVTLLGMLDRVQTKATKNNAQMAYATLEDAYGSLELVLFPRVLESCRSLLRSGQVVVVRGKLNAREDEAPKVLVSDVSIAPSPDTVPAPAEKPRTVANPGLYLKIPSLDGELWRRVQKVLRVFEGQTPVYLRVADTGKLIRTPVELWVSPEDVLIAELERVLGKENVAKLFCNALVYYFAPKISNKFQFRNDD